MLNLNHVLYLNAASCLAFGAVFVLMPTATAVFLGGNEPAPSLMLSILGAILIFNGLHLMWTARRPLPHKWLVLYFSAGDFLWALVSMALIAFNLWVTTQYGVITAVIIAIMVGFFGAMQLLKLKHINP